MRRGVQSQCVGKGHVAAYYAKRRQCGEAIHSRSPEEALAVTALGFRNESRAWPLPLSVSQSPLRRSSATSPKSLPRTPLDATLPHSACSNAVSTSPERRTAGHIRQHADANISLISAAHVTCLLVCLSFFSASCKTPSAFSNPLYVQTYRLAAEATAVLRGARIRQSLA